MGWVGSDPCFVGHCTIYFRGLCCLHFPRYKVYCVEKEGQFESGDEDDAGVFRIDDWDSYGIVFLEFVIDC